MLSVNILRPVLPHQPIALFFGTITDLSPPCPSQANINGRVLSQCNLDELKKEMEMNFGDWQLFRGMVRRLFSSGLSQCLKSVASYGK